MNFMALHLGDDGEGLHAENKQACVAKPAFFHKKQTLLQPFHSADDCKAHTVGWGEV